MEEQEDELLALHSILGSEEFVREESKPAGEIRVSAELPADFTVALTEGETLRQYEISFLPPLCLTFDLPEDYPSSSPPSFALTCSWLTHTQLSALGAQLADLYRATGGAVVLFTWVQFLKEDALRFLDIHTLLELPSDEHSGPYHNRDSLNAALSEPKNDRHTPESVSDPREPEAEHLLADGENPDSQGAVASDSCKAQQNNSTSRHSKISQKGLNSGPDADYQNPSNDSNQISQASGAGRSKRPPFAQSDHSGQEDFLNEGKVSASLSLPSRSSGPLDESEQGAASLPIQPRETSNTEAQTVSGLRLTPSQALLSQLLIYDAAQNQKAFSTTVFDCGVCFMGWLGAQCVQLPECGHIFCEGCLAKLCKLQITEGNVRGVTCPEADCPATPTPAQVRSLVGEELFSRYDRLLLQNTLDCMPDVTYCPRPSCGSAVIQEKSGTAAMCSACGFAFCVTCKKTYHGTDACQRRKNVDRQTGDTQHGSVHPPQSREGMEALWDDYTSGSKQRKHLLESRYGRQVLQLTVEGFLSDDWLVHNTKNCPYCFCRIQKYQGCNMMVCAWCRRLFCWACLERLPAKSTGTHFPCNFYQ